jgi:hypothetical protein
MVVGVAGCFGVGRWFPGRASLVQAKQLRCHVSGALAKRSDCLKVFGKLIVARSWRTTHRGMAATQARTLGSVKATVIKRKSGVWKAQTHDKDHIKKVLMSQSET